ncbi:MAG: hypothetical protein HY017_25385 [Betaproteobacteria bacterium]|nr:hypothetical protein [Betaproteobacteria bacterium]
MLGFLRFLERELQAKSGDIIPADAAQFKRIGKRIAGVKTGRWCGKVRRRLAALLLSACAAPGFLEDPSISE